MAKSRALEVESQVTLNCCWTAIRFMREELGIESEELPESYEEAKRVTAAYWASCHF